MKISAEIEIICKHKNELGRKAQIKLVKSILNNLELYLFKEKKASGIVYTDNAIVKVKKIK